VAKTAIDHGGLHNRVAAWWLPALPCLPRGTSVLLRDWDCMQVHPSRHGTYDGISMHPFEVVFVKSSWHVGEPFADKYAAWQSTSLLGRNTAAGTFDEPMYRYAVTCAPPQPIAHMYRCAVT
jgi:hypothetical protein